MTPELTASRRIQLAVEFLVLFVGIPVVMLAFFGSYSLFMVVWTLAAVSLFLVWLTPGVGMEAITRGFSRRGALAVLGFSLGTVVTCLTVAWLLVPERMFGLIIHRPQLWIMIMILYPIFSAWPQEVIYRTLFFERYGALFPSRPVAIFANGAVFAFGHLFFQNPVTILMTGLAGALIGWAYLSERSLLQAWILHSLGGMIVFTSGLGVFFYHGAIGATP